MAAVQVDSELVAADPALPDRVALAARENGILMRTLVGDALQISAAFVITRDELAEMTGGLGPALDAVAAISPAAAS